MVPNSQHPINDQTLYAYSGYRLMQGLNPILISPEVPALGKYLIGLSIVLFRNAQIINLGFVVLSMYLIWALLRKNGYSAIAASLGLLLCVTNQPFTETIYETPLLDIVVLGFLLVCMMMYLQYLKTKKVLYLILTGLAAGGFYSTKIFIMFFLMFNAWFFLFYIARRTKIWSMVKELSIINTIGVAVYGLSYLQYFLLGGSLRGFLGVQKWIYGFYSNSVIDKGKMIGSYIPLILFNKWRVWSEGYPYISYDHWSFTWPVLFIGGIIAIILLLGNSRVRRDPLFLLCVTFLVPYNLFLFSVPIFPRYFLLLFVPINIILAIWFDTIIKRTK